MNSSELSASATNASATPITPKVYLSPARQILGLALSSWGGRIGLLIFLFMTIGCLVYPALSGIDPVAMNIQARFLPPLGFEGSSWAHPLGTDQLGRDMLVRACIGLRYSLLIGICTVVLMLLIGCVLGTVAGFKGGWTDTIIMRLTDVQLSIPMIILAIAVLGSSRPSVPAIIVVLALSGWPLYSRVVRSAALAERNRDYVLSARILGASDWRIIGLLVVPNIIPPVLFVAVLDIARMVIFESILGFLGLGVQPPTPTFGNVIADGRKYLINAWWIATTPGVLLVLILTSINLMGSALERARNRVYGGQL
ncbi:ABC transporter permease [Halopseudomonas pelagia]|uniref:ABC transporter permease n=1 Tax=Halopseudomonas pelagia TaxID=553151 RepID=UPI0003A10942|nr:ABC transporter permease [Halopseudomonas pelagia]|tara:strand:- start:168 stop:1100 length:933 start_codon:yes stop_codon:yes gene_type:complete